MQKFKTDIIPVKFKPYFTNVNKIYNHFTRFSETSYFFTRVNNLYGLKSLSYLSCNLSDELPRKLKDQSYLEAFQYGLRDNSLK